jgi:hypothetical protein
MYEIMALFLALGMLVFTGYMWSIETDNADALRKENAELKREYYELLESYSKLLPPF